MFCPKCGNPNQTENTYCRNCGTFLPDFDQLKNKETPPEQHFTANLVLNAMTAVVSLGLAVALYTIFLGKEDTPFIIYLTAGFLSAIFGWQVQVFWRTLQLKKQFPKKRKDDENVENSSTNPELETPFSTDKLLPQADFSNVVPPSVVENTTKQLKQEVKSSQTDYQAN